MYVSSSIQTSITEKLLILLNYLKLHWIRKNTNETIIDTYII